MNAAPHLTVATVVERDGRFLFVEERITAGAALVLNQPAGHWEPGETLVEAAVRETQEETAWTVEPTALLGVYEYRPPDLDYSFFRFAFIARALRHDPAQPLDAGIARAVWLGADELAAQTQRHRSPMVARAVADYQAGLRHPLSLIAHLR